MIIDHIHRCDVGIQVDLTLVTPDTYGDGPIDINARWRAVGVSLMGKIRTEDDTQQYKLSEVRAGVVGLSRRWQQTQQFQLSYQVVH